MSRETNYSKYIETDLSHDYTIEATINNVSVECLVDSGAKQINLINHDWLCINLPNERYKIDSSCLRSVRVANCSEMIITGFIVLPVCIKGTVFLTPLYITRNLGTNIILGSKFVNDNRANIDCGSRRLGLQIKSQIRSDRKARDST